MSDNDDSFYDSFDSGSDSDHIDRPAEKENYLHMNVTNLRAQSAFSGDGGAVLEVPTARKDLLLLAGNGDRGQFESLSDHDDWR